MFLIAGCAGTQAQETDLSLGVNSGVVTRGIAVGRDEPSVRATATYTAAARWFVGIGAASVRSPSDHAQAFLLTGKLGYAWPVSETWGAQVDLARYAYRSSPSLRAFGRDELSATLAYRDLVVMSIAGLRNARLADGGSRFSLAYDLTMRYPLRSALSLSAGIGYQDLHRRSGFGYVYGHGGIGARLGAVQADIAYIVTDATAKTQFGASASNRWTAGLDWTF